MGSDDPSDRVQEWGMVDDGEIDVGMIGGTIVYGAITTAVSSILYFGTETVSQAGSVFDTFVDEIIWLLEEIFAVPITVLESGRAESVEFIGYWEVLSYPIAIGVIIVSMLAVQWGVRLFASN